MHCGSSGPVGMGGRAGAVGGAYGLPWHWMASGIVAQRGSSGPLGTPGSGSAPAIGAAASAKKTATPRMNLGLRMSHGPTQTGWTGGFPVSTNPGGAVRPASIPRPPRTVARAGEPVAAGDRAVPGAAGPVPDRVRTGCRRDRTAAMVRGRSAAFRRARAGAPRAGSTVVNRPRPVRRAAIVAAAVEHRSALGASDPATGRRGQERRSPACPAGTCPAPLPAAGVASAVEASPAAVDHGSPLDAAFG